MNIVVTGASGFIGKELVKKLSKEYSNDNLILLSSKNIVPYKTIIYTNYEIASDSFLNQGITDVDVLIMLGAFIPKSNSDADNISKSISNINSTVNLIENIPKPKKIIYISTIDVYNFSGDILSEETSTVPQTLYGFSKLMSEKIVSKFSVDNNIVFQILRLGHIYGKGEEQYQKLIPNTIRNVLNGNNVRIYNQGNALVSFIHVIDCVKCIFQSINLDAHVGPINIVSSQSHTVKEVVEKIINLYPLNKNVDLEYINSDSKLRNYVFDNSKMINFLSSESTNFDDGLRDEILFMRALNYNV